MTTSTEFERQALEKIQQAALARGKHTDYQRLPDFLPQSVKDSIPVTSMHLEKERLDWMLDRVDFTGKTVVEIGANSGYFSLMLAKTQNALVQAYEPFQAHAEFTRVLAGACGLRKAVTVHEEPVTLESISTLPNVDLLIFLNVIHHAGFDFNQGGHTTDKEEWLSFAIEYLSQLRQVSKTMVFQMGYTLGGVGDKLCQDADIHSFTSSLLGKSGWRILRHGAITALPLVAMEVAYSDILPGAPALTIRNTFWHRIAGRSLARLTGRKPTTTRRFAQRPIFICEPQ